MSDSKWPKSILFAGDGLQLTFETPDDLARWVAEERAIWNQLASGGSNWANTMVQNMNFLQALDADKSDSTLRRIEAEYRPSKGTLGRFISRIGTPQIRWATYNEIVRPGSTGNQMGGDFVQARALAAFFQAIGSDLIAVEQARETALSVRAAIDDVNRLRNSDGDLVTRFNSLIKACEIDWKNKIDGFETRVALNAPKTFWNSRANSHSTIAVKNRREWYWSMLAILVLILLFAIVDLIFPSPKNLSGEIVSTVRRLVIFGSLLAVAVWWLRQKLRDVRMNEFFAEDAAERATMIETYAAMRGTGLQDQDLAPILAALYRPATGNLSDDHGPILPTEIMWRVLAEAASKAK